MQLRFEDLEEHALLGCPNEKWCLDYASERRWQGWTCSRCEIFLEVKRERKEAWDGSEKKG